MAAHDVYWPELQRAIAGQKVAPRGVKAGSWNYGLLTGGASVIVDPSPANIRAWNDLMDANLETGHQAKRGPVGVQCEQGEGGMHLMFCVGAVAGVLLKGPKACAPGCEAWIIREAGLERAYRYNGQVCMPAARLKDEKAQTPLDGYRNTACALMLGEPVRKSAKYWSQPGATGVRVLRDVLATRPALVKACQAAPVPLLYIPIARRDQEGGGYEAWLVDSPEARKALGRDACHRVRIGPEGVAWWVDWLEGEPAGRVKL